jgi:hypothetical protein
MNPLRPRDPRENEILMVRSAAKQRVSNHVASSFETRLSGAPQDEAVFASVTA